MKAQVLAKTLGCSYDDLLKELVTFIQPNNYVWLFQVF